MAAGEMTPTTLPWPAAPARAAATSPRALVVRYLLEPLASLKLTVVLLFLAIGIVFFGTMAQWQKDIWQVIQDYFSTWIARIDLQILFPPSFFPSAPQVSGWFPFPGGKLIGSAMLVNLLAAHGVRFKVQSSGTRLVAGLTTIALGCLMTWLVILGGSNKDGILEFQGVTWTMLWEAFRFALGIVEVGLVASIFLLPGRQKVARAILIVAALVVGGVLGYVLYMGDAARFSDSAMRILWQLTKGGLAACVLLAGCALVFKKRAGIVLLHAGLGLVMINEVVVRTSHVETQMRVIEGQTVNFVEDSRTLELAVIDPSPKDHDDVVAIPKTLLTRGETIADDNLPFDLQVVRFLQNSDLRVARAEDENPATAGLGLEWIAEELRPSAGADSDSKIDMSAAYITFLRKGSRESLGTYLVPWVLGAQDIPEKVAVDGKQYDVYLRFKRYYKPYSVTLLDVRKDDYPGTDTPRNYSSDIHLIDPTRNVDRKPHIWMNNPLRFADETFYQSGYHKLDDGREMTTLSVVSNTGWMIPYVSCAIVGVGMLAHFLIVLVRFLNRQERASPVVEAAAEVSWRTRGVQLVPLAIVLLAAAWLGSKAAPPRTAAGAMDLDAFGKLPVQYEGRVKPLDTVARNSLRYISDRQTFQDEQGQTQPAIRWLLDVATGSEAAIRHKVFRIDNLEVLDVLRLEPRSNWLYALEEFRDQAEEFEKQVALAEKTPKEQRSLFHARLLELDRKVKTFTLLRAAFVPPHLPAFPTEEEFKQNRQAAAEQMADIRTALQEATRMAQQLVKMNPPSAVPPDQGQEKWGAYSTAYVRAYVAMVTGEEVSPATHALLKIFDAYRRNNATFNAAVAGYQQWLDANPPPHYEPARTHFEAFFNHAEPFYWLLALYVGAFLLQGGAWLTTAMASQKLSQTLRRSALLLIVFTFAVHTAALAARIYISGRPPVTNLYSSAVFIGWGAVGLGSMLELLYRIGIGNLIASVIGFATLVIAHYLAAGGDTFTVLQAVLDTQFWLATHVVCITLGYATTYVAGFLGIFYILAGMATPALNAKFSRTLSAMIYGVLCFSIFFSFVGTVLGGLWADDSWGRFWGWDPKENGALMIVLWNAIVLHARWGALVQDRGLAILATAGNIFVTWSWFGVNALGLGLHAYADSSSVVKWLAAAVIAHLAIIGVAALPKDLWWSYRARGAAA